MNALSVCAVIFTSPSCVFSLLESVLSRKCVVSRPCKRRSSTSATRLYVCRASSKRRGVMPVLMQISSSLSSEPKQTRCTRQNSTGHKRRVCSSLSVNIVTASAPSSATMDSSCHALVRANPCAGAWGSSAFARNQGKQIGIPPRMAWPPCQRDFELTKSTSSAPAGFQDVTWAPCKYISPSALVPVIWTRVNPPLPPQSLATPGIPNCRSNSSSDEIAFILDFYQKRN